MKLPGRQRKGLLTQRGSSNSAQNERLDSQQWRGHKFDESTGQVFIERTARVISSNDQYWTNRTRLVYGRNEKEELKEEEVARAWDNQRSERNGGHIHSQSRVRVGARSLQSIALESVIQNISELAPCSCIYLPVTLVKRIWDAVRKRCYVSFDTWALFSKLLHNEDKISDDLLRYAESFPTPKLQFAMYIAPLISNNFDFITCLCITTPLPVPDLIKISKIRNLGTLEIINTDTSSSGYARMGVSDRLIRGWYLAATSEGALPILRVLRLWNHEDLTSKSLPFLNGFPSLAVYDVRGCCFNPKEKVQAINLGWKLIIETDILKVLERTCGKRTDYLRKQIQANPGLHPFSKDGIQRLPRDELATFLVNHQASIELKQKNSSKKSNNVMERVINMDIYGLGKHQDFDDWEHSTYRTYARIGELRNDTDIQRAGVPISDAFICGHELLTPKPLVLLRLGQSTEKMMPTTKTSINAVSFIRIKAPSAEDVRSESVSSGSGPRGNANNAALSQREVVASGSSWKENTTTASLDQRDIVASSSRSRKRVEPEAEEAQERLPHRAQSSLRSLSIARTQTSVQKGKKRSLHDMLGSFL